MCYSLLPLTLLGLSICVQPPEPPPATRTVKDNVLSSKEKPAVQLRFDQSFQYVGHQTFILYGVATAEQHFFVDADEKKNIRRLYWIQFEGYLPSNTHTYNYRSKTKATLGPLEFFADAAPRNLKNKGRPDSDGAKAQAFLAEKGFQMASSDVISQRLVHLLDEKKRDELMIIYMEDLTPLKLTAADLSPTSKAADQWPALSEGLLKRALQSMEIVK